MAFSQHHVDELNRLFMNAGGGSNTFEICGHTGRISALLEAAAVNQYVATGKQPRFSSADSVIELRFNL